MEDRITWHRIVGTSELGLGGSEGRGRARSREQEGPREAKIADRTMGDRKIRRMRHVSVINVSVSHLWVISTS